MIIDTECTKIINSISLNNALGVEWSYKLNIMDNNVYSYVALSRRSDSLYKALPVPIDESKLKHPSLKTGSFHNHF